MKNITLLFVQIILLFTCSIAFSQSPKFNWAKGQGGKAYDYGYGITTDDSGDVYITGYFQDTVDFDPGSGTHNLVSAGGFDVFIQKLSAQGKFIWAKRVGGSGGDYAYSILTDENGNSYTIGKYSSTADFDPGSGTTNIKARGSSDAFILKLDRNGNFAWAKSMGGSIADEGRSIAYDQNGGLYSTGRFGGTVDFDPGSGTNNLVAFGSSDVFVQKLDTNGDFIWAKKIGGRSADYGQSIAADTLGYIYLSGYFAGTADFDPSSSTTTLTSNGGRDIYVAKLDTACKLEWAIHVGDKSNDYGQGVAVGPKGDVYSIGYFEGTVDFDPGSGTKSLKSFGQPDIYILKVSSKGTFEWVRQNGGSSIDIGMSVHVDTSGNVFSTGYFWGTGDFDPGAATETLKSLGGPDVFIQKLDSKGKLIWAKSMGGTDYEEGRTIHADHRGNIYTTGFHKGTSDFDPGSGTFSLKSSGKNDIFIQKLSECVAVSETDKVISCDSYKWIDGMTYSSNNANATHLKKGSGGCDTLVKLNLTILKSSFSTDTIIACDSFQWMNGVTYFKSTTSPRYTIPNQMGCDSVISLNLTVNYSAEYTDVVQRCDSFRWINGKTYFNSNSVATHLLKTTEACDSLIKLDLTIRHSTSSVDKRSACDSLTWIDGHTYYADNNSATYKLTNSSGCDSLVTLDLTMNKPSFSSDIQTACDSLEWINGITYYESIQSVEYTLPTKAQNGCDSIVRLDLTIVKPTSGVDEQSACESYIWVDGINYTESNSTAEFNLVGANQDGCDSIVRLDLTIRSVGDLSTTQTGETISSNNNNATYTWLDCMRDYSVIAGETKKSFRATENGSYAVELKENGCVDTTKCVDITTFGIVENSLKSRFTIYPNPTSGIFFIDFEELQDQLQFTLTSSKGDFIRRWKVYQKDQVEINLNVATGIYYLEVLKPLGQRAIVKMVKH